MYVFVYSNDLICKKHYDCVDQNTYILKFIVLCINN